MSTWKNDPAHSRLGFVARHLAITDIYGRFADASLTVETTKPDLTDAVFTLTAQTADIDTRVPPRDEHLRSAVSLAWRSFPNCASPAPWCIWGPTAQARSRAP